MNEEQFKNFYIATIHRNPNDRGKNWLYDFDEDHARALAELIVQECMNICEATRDESVDPASADYNEGRRMAAEVCRNRIYEKFFGNSK